MRWRNDPETLKMSINTKPKLWDSFYKEFLNEYFSVPNLSPLFILLNSQRVAFVQFEPVEHPEHIQGRRCVEISINVASEYRGKGLGTAILKATQDWIKQQGFDDIFAVIRPENRASKKAFVAAGYKPMENGVRVNEEIGEKIEICRFIARLTPSDKNDAVFITAEAGSNWRMGTAERDLEMAKILIDIAAEAGADAIKFQIFRPETIYVPNAGKSSYLAAAGIELDTYGMFSDY